MSLSQCADRRIFSLLRVGFCTMMSPGWPTFPLHRQPAQVQAGHAGNIQWVPLPEHLARLSFLISSHAAAASLAHHRPCGKGRKTTTTSEGTYQHVVETTAYFKFGQRNLRGMLLGGLSFRMDTSPTDGSLTTGLRRASWRRFHHPTGWGRAAHLPVAGGSAKQCMHCRIPKRKRAQMQVSGPNAESLRDR